MCGRHMQHIHIEFLKQFHSDQRMQAAANNLIIRKPKIHHERIFMTNFQGKNNLKFDLIS